MNRLLQGLSDEGFALVVDMLANEEITVDASITHVRGTWHSPQDTTPESLYADMCAYCGHQALHHGRGICFATLTCQCTGFLARTHTLHDTEE